MADPTPAEAAGAAEIQEAFDAAQAQGFFGNGRIDTFDAEEFSLETGPDSPNAMENIRGTAQRDAEVRGDPNIQVWATPEEEPEE